MLSGPSVKALFFPMFSKWSNGGGGGASPLQQYQTCTWIQTESKDIFFYPLYIEGSRATQSRWDSVLSRVNQTSLPVCQVSLEGKKEKKNCWWGRMSTDSYVILSLVSCGEVLFNPLDKLHPDFRHVVPPQCVLDKFHIHSHLDLEIEKFTINFKFSPAIMNIRHCFLNISQIHISPVRLGTALIQ